jgi:hypothetical protein
MGKVIPVIADGMSQFFGAIITINATLPVGSLGGDIKTIQYVIVIVVTVM